MSNSNGNLVPVSAQYPDICDFLIGTWKRSLRWKQFGGSFSNIRTTNTVVHIEEYKSNVDESGVRYLKWSFGKTSAESDLRFGYVMKFTKKATTNTTSKASNCIIEWQYNGLPCTGTYQATTSVIVLHFLLKESTVVITYRIADQMTLAVCITEIDNQHTPTIQIGSMCRVSS